MFISTTFLFFFFLSCTAFIKVFHPTLFYAFIVKHNEQQHYHQIVSFDVFEKSWTQGVTDLYCS